MSTKFMPVTCVIFDVDGLLLNTEDLYTEVMHAIVNPHGKRFTYEIKTKMMGKSTDEAAEILISELDLPITVQDYRNALEANIPKIFPSAEVLPGVERLVKHLKKHNIPMALASGSSEWEYSLKIQRHLELFSIFDHGVFSSSDPEVNKGKPAPDVFNVAAKRFKIPPDHNKVLVFEDAPNGVEGALAAGMQVVWIPDDRANKSDIINKATLTLKSMTEFIPESFGLPPYES